MLEITVNTDSANEFKKGVDSLGDYLAEKFYPIGFLI
jgi:hypothetical protein